MKKRTVDTDRPSRRAVRVEDFLPPPQELFAEDGKIKVTITLNRQSLNFFKRYARSHHMKYQKMIRTLLDKYVSLHQSLAG